MRVIVYLLMSAVSYSNVCSPDAGIIRRVNPLDESKEIEGSICAKQKPNSVSLPRCGVNCVTRLDPFRMKSGIVFQSQADIRLGYGEHCQRVFQYPFAELQTFLRKMELMVAIKQFLRN